MNKFEMLMDGFCLQTGMAKEQILGKEPINLVFDEKIGVEINNDSAHEEVCLASKLFQVDNQEDIGAMALMVSQANFEKNYLYRAHLAMSEEGTIVLLRAAPLSTLNEASFSKMMLEFVDAAMHWSDSITSMSKLLKEHQSNSLSLADEDLGVGMGMQIKV